MQVDVYEGLMTTTRMEASRVVVYDNLDNPIAIVVEVEPGHYVVARAGNKQFNELLKVLGINKSLVVNKLDVSKLQPLI